MSGDGFGALVAGALLIAVAPVVLAATAVAGLAFAAVKVGGFVASGIADYAAEKKREKELVINECSSELSYMYGEFQSTISAQNTALANSAKRLENDYEDIKLKLEKMDFTPDNFDEIDAEINSARETFRANIGVVRSAITNEINASLNKMNADINEINRSFERNQELIDWANNTTDSINKQKEAALTMIREAKASVKLLENMNEISGDASFSSQVDAIKITLTRAEESVNIGAYQSAFSSARSIVSQAAIIASHHIAEKSEADILKITYKGMLEGQYQFMEKMRKFEHTNESGTVIKADLDKFSQNTYVTKMNSLKSQIEMLDTTDYSVNELDAMIQDFNATTEPEVYKIVDTSQKIMASYYNRLKVLDVVNKFMADQDYTMQWAMPVGADPSQKMVVNFEQKTTKNKISITLDNDVSNEDIADMAMEVLTYYGSGAEVTEEEKLDLRTSLNKAMRDAGVYGSIMCCEGTENKESTKPEFAKKNDVRNMTVVNKLE